MPPNEKPGDFEVGDRVVAVDFPHRNGKNATVISLAKHIRLDGRLGTFQFDGESGSHIVYTWRFELTKCQDKKVITTEAAEYYHALLAAKDLIKRST